MDKKAATKRAYYEQNREALLLRQRELYAENIDAERQKDKEKYQRIKETRKAYDREFRAQYPEKALAKSAVYSARRKKLLPNPRELLCALCGKSASDYHHPSYGADEKLNVVPLCRSCHVREHDRPTPSSGLGIIVLPIGVVRIAIASIK